MEELKKQFRNCLENNILSFWLNKVTDNEHGGYYGRVDGHDVVHPEAEKGAILNARILWAFAASYRVLKKAEYLKAAERARDYIFEHFIDKEFGGVYWSVDYKGNVLDDKKQSYAIGFTIYGMSELARANGDRKAFDCAVSLFRCLEEHAFDNKNNGYIEALTRQWKPIADMRLSDKDENGSRTMNTHLHIIEPYTNLLRVLKGDHPDSLVLTSEEKTTLRNDVEHAVRNLLDIFTDKLLNKETYHLDLFFNDEWQGKRNIQSFGHDIEASWLLHETALVLGDKATIERIEPLVRLIAAAADEGLQADGSTIYEKWTDTGREDRQRQWWVMCESIIGHANLYEHFGMAHELGKCIRAWEYVQKYLIDNEHGEWHWARLDDGTINLDDDKAGFWKCPYHNSRMCLEIMERNI